MTCPSDVINGMIKGEHKKHLLFIFICIEVIALMFNQKEIIFNQSDVI